MEFLRSRHILWMKITIANSAGFCPGVRRAVEMALEAPRKHKNPIFTFGPLIHNPQILSFFQEKGISVMHDIPDHGSGTVIIRTHGVSPRTKEDLQKAGFNIIDATCPRVAKVQTIIQTHIRQGYSAIIIGDRKHPEILGLLGYAGGKGYVINSLEGLDSLPSFGKAIIVAQTTQNTLFYEEVKRWAARRVPFYKIFDTICDTTVKRQAELINLAKLVDVIIVIGGYNSGNTRRLFEIARQTGKPAYHVETELELDFKTLASASHIGITAGASTPEWIIKRISSTLEAELG